MRKLNSSNHLLHSIFTLMFISLLFGCTNPTKKTNTKFNIKGDIYSQSMNIPKNSDITLSITRLDVTHPSQNSFDSYFRTIEANHLISFTINLPNELVNSTQKLGISVRVEKEGELIMMSNKIVEIPIDHSKKLSLPVISIQ